MSCRATTDHLIMAALDRPDWFGRCVVPKVSFELDGCWLWTGSKSPQGYGAIAIPREDGASIPVRATRVIWHELVGGIPENMVLDHDGPDGCHDKRCVNPGHLRIATFSENSRARVNTTTECPNGHPLEGDNLMPSQAKRGARQCLTCNREHGRISGAAIRAAARALGLGVRQYRQEYGQSRYTALAILAEFEAVAA